MGWPKVIKDFLSHLIDPNPHGASNTSKPNTLIKSNENGHLDKSWFEVPLTFKTFKSGGTTKSGYLLANDQDLVDVFNTIDTITLETTGDTTGDLVVSNVTMRIDNKQLNGVITKYTLSYCTHCTHCSKTHCTYCTYCTYCNCDNRCNCDCIVNCYC